MNDDFEKYKTIEEWFLNQDDTNFPEYDKSRGEKSYIERYKLVVDKLKPVHNQVEKAALACSDDDKVYLNSHDQSHIKSVIDKASNILRLFDAKDFLSPYEAFILLCAIQIHDIGNTFGRDEREKNASAIFNSLCNRIIPDALERRTISQIAATHGGNINGDKDTISNLHYNDTLFNYKIRSRVIAAILRLADELADGTYRADRIGLEFDTIPKESQLFHQYSLALHTTQLINDYNRKTVKISLGYYFTSDIAKIQFSKGEESVYLLDEIYYRTKKMEQERRYCMRFLRPHCSIEEIHVEIIIQHEKKEFVSDDIKYTLCENGYPNMLEQIEIKAHSGKEALEYLISEGGEL